MITLIREIFLYLQVVLTSRTYIHLEVGLFFILGVFGHIYYKIKFYRSTNIANIQVIKEVNKYESVYDEIDEMPLDGSTKQHNSNNSDEDWISEKSSLMEGTCLYTLFL